MLLFQINLHGKNVHNRSALYRGWFSAVISLFTTNFVYFLFFHGCRGALSLPAGLTDARSNVEVKIVVDLVVGIAAGKNTHLVVIL